MRSKLTHNLARLRVARHWSQRQVAILAGCSYGTIQAVELGRLKLSRPLAVRLAASLNVPAEWLLANDLQTPLPLLIDWEIEAWL